MWTKVKNGYVCEISTMEAQGNFQMPEQEKPFPFKGAKILKDDENDLISWEWQSPSGMNYTVFND